MRKRYTLDNGQLVETTQGPLRVDIYAKPDNAERQELVSELGIDEHAVASALDPEEVSRIELEGDRAFIIWKRPSGLSLEQRMTFEVRSLGIILERNHLVLVQADEEVSLEDRTLRACRSLNELLLRLLTGTIHHYLAHLRVIRRVSRELQEKLNTSMENTVFLQMLGLSESLVYYVNALDANSGVLARMANMTQKLGFSPQEVELLEDLTIDNRQCLRQGEIYASILSGLMDARGNIINNNMNVLLKNLTIINIVFLPLNLIAGMGGMSEYSVWTRSAHWVVSYGLFTVGMVVLGILTWKLLNRRIERNKPR